MNAAPQISVLVPVRNGARFLGEALESLLTQTGVSLEILAINDASTDATPRILADFAGSDPRVRVFAGPGRGLSRALNLGLAQARADYVARLDADDVALPGRLQAQYRFLEGRPELGVVGTQAVRINEASRRLGRMRVPCGRHRVRAALETSCALIHPTVMMRRAVLLAVGGYRPSLDDAEDYDLWLRLSEVTELDNLPEPGILFRRHGAQVTHRRPLRQARRTALALLSHRLRVRGMPDPFQDRDSSVDWRAALRRLDPQVRMRLHLLMAAALADNGGTQTPRGQRLLEAACARVEGLGDPILSDRMALAWVRHRLQQIRGGNPGPLLGHLPPLGAWGKVRWMRAVVRHAGILWRSRLCGRFSLTERIRTAFSSQKS